MWRFAKPAFISCNWLMVVVAPTQVSKFERLRLTGGDPEATLAWMDTEGGRKPPTNPQNAWTQGKPAGSAGPSAGQARGQWSKQGKLAHEWKTIQDAWSQK